ncbi:hypothetical protein BGZ73_002234, partial [Actinomortierella ambigua]
MVYKAPPPVLEHAEVNLSGPAKQHDHDLAIIQGYLANTTRFYDSLAHDVLELGQDETEFGIRVLDFLNLVRRLTRLQLETSIHLHPLKHHNDATKISNMRKDIYHAHLGIKITSSKEKPLLTLESLAATKAAAETIKNTYKKYEPAKQRNKYGSNQGRDKSSSGDKPKDHTP